MASSTGGGGVEKNVAIVYTVEGVTESVQSQEQLEAALKQAKEALDAQTESFEEAMDQAWAVDRAQKALTESTERAGQQALLTQQRVTAFASGLGQLSAIIGTETEAGALLGRMAHFSSAGIQIGSIFGPGGAVVGGITGAVIPAMQSLFEALEDVDSAQRRVTVSVDMQTESYAALLTQIRAVNRERNQTQTLSMGLGSLEEQEAAVQLQERTLHNLAETARALTAQPGTEQNLAALTAVGRARRLTEQRLNDAREALDLARADMEADVADFIATGNLPGQGPAERRRGGRRRERETNWGKLEDLMGRAAGGSDAIGFAAGLGDDGPPGAGEIESARGRGRARTGGAFDAQRGAEQRAQRAAIEELDRMQKDKHDRQMERIQEEADAWGAAGQKIGSTLYNAFQIAATGQESLDVAVVKSFKALGIQFGGQMVSEGIGALLTAIGNATNPATAAIAAAKAAEGAGKLALGIGLGAAGAAIPVPAAGGGAQSSTPRLGPQGSGETGGARSVVVNMNAPSVVTGTRAVVGREIGRALDDASLRFGRRMSA